VRAKTRRKAAPTAGRNDTSMFTAATSPSRW
jgi:hypothetical protein